MATLPGTYNFSVKQDGPWSESIVWKIDGTGVDLTGYTVTLRLKFLTGDVTFTNPSTLTVTSTGTIAWTIPQATVQAWVGFIDYDIRAVSGDGDVNWLLAGTLEVIA